MTGQIVRADQLERGHVVRVQIRQGAEPARGTVVAIRDGFMAELYPPTGKPLDGQACVVATVLFDNSQAVQPGWPTHYADIHATPDQPVRVYGKKELKHGGRSTAPSRARR